MIRSSRSWTRSAPRPNRFASKCSAISDPQILAALIDAHKRGIKIRVMLNPARRSGEIQNKGSRSVLGEAGIDVLDTNPAFDVTHEKSMVVDDKAHGSDR